MRRAQSAPSAGAAAAVQLRPLVPADGEIYRAFRLDALAAFPDTSQDALSELGSRVGETEAETASLARQVEQLVAARPNEHDDQLADRLEPLERRLSTLAEEIGRAKTLWPVALGSLEGRLDDLSRLQDERSAAATH